MEEFLEQDCKLDDILPEKTLKTRTPQFRQERIVRPALPRYRNEISRYIILRDEEKCAACGRCAALCPQGVHVRKPGYKYFTLPKSHLCIGPACEKKGCYCVTACPQGALRIQENPMMKVLGDYRWPAGMILATWKMAETGEVPPEEYGYEFETGDSGGGFDRIRFRFPEKPPLELRSEEIDTSLELNRRNDGRPRIRIDVPWYGGGMSFGSVSNTTQLSKARAAVAWNTFTCTGEGGFMERMRPYDDHMITQVATGLFGVREETIQRVRIVEFKYAQGAKPGLGGHLLGDKNTEAVAKMRETVVGISLFSPFPFHSVYSIEDHMKHIDWVKHINRRALISTKVSTPNDVDMVAVGSYSAGTHIIHLDGGYGGTGAAPDIAKKNIAMPIEYAISKVHDFLSGRRRPGPGDARRQRRCPQRLRHRQGDRARRRRLRRRHGGAGGPRVPPVRPLFHGPGLSPLASRPRTGPLRPRSTSNGGPSGSSTCTTPGGTFWSPFSSAWG